MISASLPSSPGAAVLRLLIVTSVSPDPASCTISSPRELGDVQVPLVATSCARVTAHGLPAELRVRSAYSLRAVSSRSACTFERAEDLERAAAAGARARGRDARAREKRVGGVSAEFGGCVK